VVERMGPGLGHCKANWAQAMGPIELAQALGRERPIPIPVIRVCGDLEAQTALACSRTALPLACGLSVFAMALRSLRVWERWWWQKAWSFWITMLAHLAILSVGLGPSGGLILASFFRIPHWCQLCPNLRR
jgi:hypothetical protein